ncbi:MAG TPA: Do family serine endopeptidase [Beijerinckiaceae bacterium]|nr:Do family serine endopeptidase [Beijerinckiaceae bacterium]
MPSHPPRQRPARPRFIAAAAALGLAVACLSLAGADPLAGPAQAKEMASLADLAASVSDAVVNISAATTTPERFAQDLPDLPNGTPFDDLFRRFFKRRLQGQNGAPAPMERRSTSLGSGFVIDPSGIIVTDNHVIAGANEITVIFTDGRKLKAKVIGRDKKVDVAVLRVTSAKPLKAVKFGDSDRMRVGDPVMAVGNPFGLGGTVTAGIVSARNRIIDNGPYDDFIQTDAAINKGNSGGPLFNMAGEVIGINTAILSPSGGSIGIGFATPAATVIPVIAQLRKYGEVRRGWLGVRIQNVDAAIAESLNLGKPRGALVAGVDADGPAKAAGLKAGDVIVAFAGKPVKTAHDLPEIVASTHVGAKVDVAVIRNGQRQSLHVTLGRLKDAKKKAPARTNESKNGGAAPRQGVAQQALGMNFARLDDDMRQRYGIKQGLKGVVVTRVAPDSVAADKQIKPGELIVELNQQRVAAPEDVANKAKELKDSGRKAALLLMSSPKGVMRFVALPLD